MDSALGEVWVLRSAGLDKNTYNAQTDCFVLGFNFFHHEKLEILHYCPLVVTGVALCCRASRRRTMTYSRAGS